MLSLLIALVCCRSGNSHHRSHRKYFRKAIEANANYGVVSASSGLNVRNGPGTSYAKITALPYGTRVQILSSQGGWYKISYGSTTGWVSGDYLTIESGGGSEGGKVITGFQTTGYYPDNSAMEGGYYDCFGNRLRTLQQYLSYSAAYVSLAVDPSVIPKKSIVHIDGYVRDGTPVKFWACDVGGAIKGKHVDICVANAKESYKVTKTGVTLTVYGTSSRPT